MLIHTSVGKFAKWKQSRNQPFEKEESFGFLEVINYFYSFLEDFDLPVVRSQL